MLKKYDAYIAGYYGMENSGDDALMQATAWAAKNLLQYDKVNVGLYSNINDSLPTSDFTRLYYDQRFSGQNRLAQYKAAIRSKAVIFGGGSVLHTESDINLKRHLMRLSNAKNSRAVGVSLGPFQSVAAEKSCTKFLNECGFIGVRDQKSLDIAQSLAPNANVEKTFDLAPLLLCAKKQTAPIIQRSGIALSLCSVAINPMGQVDPSAEQKRIEDFCQLITELYETTGEPITLLEFNGHHLLGDWQINNAILKQLGNKVPVTYKPYNPNPFSVLEDLASYKVLINMRLHGSILGYLAKTPIISVNYHEKCQGWCEQIGLKAQYQFNLQDLNISELSKQVEQGLANEFIAPSLSVSTALKNALSNWSLNHEQAKFYCNYSAV